MKVVPEERNRTTKIRPKFYARRMQDLMIRGGVFYAIWDESETLWSTDFYRAVEIIDNEILKEYDNYISKYGNDKSVFPALLSDYSSKMLDEWNRFCKAVGDTFVPLNETIIFANEPSKREDYITKKLPYSLEDGNHEAWDELVHTLYSEEEAEKIEWLIGCIATGDSKQLQKFFVFYGSGGTGKSTILHVIEDLFDGFWIAFEAKTLASSSDSFALEPFSSYPLIGINHDGELDRIENNTRINSLVSHERMVINEKHKKQYGAEFHTILLMGTNKPVKITDAKSGLIRRVIDIMPSGNLLTKSRYDYICKQVRFELGAICKHCIDVYEKNKNKYNNYIPERMIASTNYMYDFVSEYFNELSVPEGVSLNYAYQLYSTYKDNALLAYPLNKLNFKEELKNYYKSFIARSGDGRYNVFSDFIFDKFKSKIEEEYVESTWIDLKEQDSLLDLLYSEFPAQYATNDENERPLNKWSKVKTLLKDLDTHRVHYVQCPINYIFLDFDLKDSEGQKSLALNIRAANNFPPTYAETSKGGQGLHLYYIYAGDPLELESLYMPGIEIKVMKGDSAIRRKLYLCNDLPIATISSGLPLKQKKGDKMVNEKRVENETHLRSLIAGNLLKRYLPSTKSSIDMIKKVTDEAYESGISYDITDMYQDIFQFASESTNQAEYCMKTASKLKLRSEFEHDEEFERDIVNDDWNNAPIVIFDIEVFPNLIVICYKKLGGVAQAMINPTPEQARLLLKYRLIGFNNRRYDNHILFAICEGYSIKEVYNVSQKIISKDQNAFFGQAWNYSYTDIYDFASAGNKMSLKKWEIKLNIHHQELGYDWNKPVPEEKWSLVMEYCKNDVNATEAVWEYLQGDFTAREILADLANGTVNETTNTLTQRIIFGNDKEPQCEFNYRNLAEPVNKIDTETYNFLREYYPNFTDYKTTNEFPFVREGIHSALPFFPDYIFEGGKSTYKGVEVGEGGLVWAKPGIYYDVEVMDIASMHPTSIICECLFGPKYTKRFAELKMARLYIKHKEWDKMREMMGGKLAPYVDKIISGEINPKDLSNALKTAINSVYGLTAAGFKNKFRDSHNVDNIVAKRGALFMVDLMNVALDQGYNAFHIKTDSIKIAIDSADEHIRDYIFNFGSKYGYEFEIEDTFEKICLVNNAVYIAKDHEGEWHATGAQFAVPYVFKKLFSKEPLNDSDLAQTFNVSKGELYLDFNEKLGEEDHDLKFVGRTGLFYPIKPGCGGGELRRELNDKLYYPPGAKGYRFMEKEVVDASMVKLEDIIDYSFWENMVQDAKETIGQFGDFDKFIQ